VGRKESDNFVRPGREKERKEKVGEVVLDPIGVYLSRNGGGDAGYSPVTDERERGTGSCTRLFAGGNCEKTSKESEYTGEGGQRKRDICPVT